ncbi:3-isopropylmalate dehydratase small subunit [Algimonas porphyrae]|uniref:3-isopropylmalate dehydratase small subunit n=1 Tax=Algimonas porphyrae TaxID=1128113 RepID=A0ABQ5UWF2_9PROT|nr:3-isopropylmalate dehydratase small subunit [Algimonas porphyrae]GLQ19601.1 3-isopropylmalate dehydratase small subunit [Algimonas porphyrae]
MNTPFITHDGIAAPLRRDNIDTDQIIPSREMKSVSKTGLAKGLFAGQRYLDGRTPNPDFVLNQPDFAEATILLGGSNFGCGSSREHAVWALKEYGIRAVIAPSFGEIFWGNMIGNGLLPIMLEEPVIDQLPHRIHIDLPAQTVSGHPFAIDAAAKRRLVEGLDAIAQTLQHQPAIEAFLTRDRKDRPWVY